MSSTYTIQSDRLTATFDPNGARLRRLYLDQGPNLVLDIDDSLSPAMRDAYGGAIVGPLANRVRDGKVAIGEQHHQMPCNENGITALHSGPDGLDRAMWDVTAHDQSSLGLRHHLPDGHGGLPGNRTITALFMLSGNTLSLQLTMTTDAATPASIAHHPYWRVTPDHRLHIHAGQYLPTDDINLPTGAIENVAGTLLDHRTPRPIGANTDHNFCVATSKAPSPRAIATLSTPTYLLHIASTEPGLQAYSGAFLPTLPEANIAPLSGIALEPQGWPDAVNHSNFPSVICTPDHPYSQTTEYTVHPAT